MIGVYDSGVGGLPVLRRLRELAPEADLTYLADQASVPYGERPLEEVRSLAQAATGRLVEWGASTVVVACNSASAAALDDLRVAFPEVTIVGIEPAVKPAVAASRTGMIGVLATEATFAADRFRRLLDRYAAGTDVIALPCPGWAAAIEESWPNAGAVDPIADHLSPLLDKGVDILVLGCTHYTFLSRIITGVVDDGVAVIDPVDPVAQQTLRVADVAGEGWTEYITTGDPARLAAQIERLVGERVEVAAAG